MSILARPKVEFVRSSGELVGVKSGARAWDRMPIEGEFIDLSTDREPELAGEVIAVLWTSGGCIVRVAVDSEYLEPVEP